MFSAAQFPVRLVDGGKPYRGRLEIFARNRWGTVCKDHFGPSEALVACSQLGYTGYTSYSGRYGSSNGPIWMDDVECPSSDNNLMERNGDKVLTRLADCNKGGSVFPFRAGLHWGSHNCDHSKDVGLVCSSAGITLHCICLLSM